MEIFELLAKVKALKDAVNAGDWGTALDLTGDLLKLAGELVGDRKVKMMVSGEGPLTDEEKAKLDPATIALIVALFKMGLEWLIALIKKRRGL